MWPLTDRFSDALTAAVEFHEGQFRKGYGHALHRPSARRGVDRARAGR